MPKRKCKIDTFEKKYISDNNSIPYTIFEVIEEIKKTLDNYEVIDSCNSQISNTLDDIPKLTPKNEIKVPLEKVNSKKSLINPVDLQSSSLEKNCNPQIDNVTKSTNQKRKFNTTKLKNKEKNASFKYGNYNR